MNSEGTGWAHETVSSLEASGALLVQDGNHGAYRPLRDEIVPDGTPHIRAADISDFGEIDFEGAQRINDVARQRINKGVGAPGDTLLTHKGTVGRVARVPADSPPFVCSPQTTFWRSLDTERIDPGYLHVFLRSNQFAEQLRRRMNESDMAPYVSLTAQRSLTLVLPPIEEQRRIARVPGVLDAKIENNRRLAHTLGETVATMFKARFVDFLGQDDLIDSPIGQIPRGWSVRPVSELASFVNGKAFTKFGIGRGRMVIRIADLKTGPGGSTVYTDHEAAAENTAYTGDILFAWSGSLDVYRWHREEALVNQHIFKVIPSDFPSWFVFHALKTVMPEFQRIAADKATTMGHIKRGDLDKAIVACPPPTGVSAAHDEFAPLFDRLLAAQVESESLALVQGAVLQQLISGKLRVPEGAVVA